MSQIEGGIKKILFDTPIASRGTLAEILARKAAKKGITTLMDEKREEINPAAGKLAFYSMVAKLASLGLSESELQKNAVSTEWISKHLNAPRAKLLAGSAPIKEKLFGLLAGKTNTRGELRDLVKEKIRLQGHRVVESPTQYDAPLTMLKRLKKDPAAYAEYSDLTGKFNGLHKKQAELDKEAPFKSEAQRRKFYAMESRGEISKKVLNEWESATPDKKLPERVEKKEAALHFKVSSDVEKLAILGAVMKGGTFLAKSMLIPSGFKQLATYTALTGAGAARAGMSRPPVSSQISQLASENTLEMLKQSIEFHMHSPGSNDKAEPDVKKKSLSKDCSLQAAVSPGATAQGISALTKGPSSSTSNWLKRSTTGHAKLNVGSSPEGKQMAGPASTEDAGGAGSGPHIQRGF